MNITSLMKSRKYTKVVGHPRVILFREFIRILVSNLLRLISAKIHSFKLVTRPSNGSQMSKFGLRSNILLISKTCLSLGQKLLKFDQINFSQKFFFVVNYGFSLFGGNSLLPFACSIDYSCQKTISHIFLEFWKIL